MFIRFSWNHKTKYSNFNNILLHSTKNNQTIYFHSLLFPSFETAGSLPSVLLCFKICFIYSEIPSNLLCCSPIFASFSLSFWSIFLRLKSSFCTFIVVAFYFFLIKSESYFSYFLILSLNSWFNERSLLHSSISFVFWARTALIFYSRISL